MKYFFDTEFLEGTQKKTFLGFNCGNTKPTIDLISIGIVEEDSPAFSKRIRKTDRTYKGREYYAISKDFNLKEAWNRYEWKRRTKEQIKHTPALGTIYKEYWIRDNVLLPILKELAEIDDVWAHGEDDYFTYKVAKRIINKYGKSSEQIAEEVKEFVYNQSDEDRYNGTFKSKPEFYGYYADYDWVVFCWLFGKMIDLPNGFPMYCKDLKQIMDSIIRERISPQCYVTMDGLKKQFDAGKINNGDLSEVLKWVKTLPNYPKQTNEHSAIHDARWNKKLYEFLTEI